MTTIRTIIIFVSALSMFVSCQPEIKVYEKNKIFHAGPVNSGFSGIYWGLYKDNIYQFCDGDFMDYGCYTGKYSLVDDTVTLHNLKKHTGIPTNKFIIRRYNNMDSSYWTWKYPNTKLDWKELRHSDSLNGSTGDVLPLDENNRTLLNKDNYFLIRLDNLKNNP